MPPAPSFRDPGGVCFSCDNRILRAVEPAIAADLERFLGASVAKQWIEQGRLIPTRRLGRDEAAALDGRIAEVLPSASRGRMTLLEHERVWFPSFAHEWAPAMLHAAAELTLDLTEAALGEGFGLKDATPGNVLFRGSAPVFIDVLSFEPRAEGDPVWKPYAQFVRTFLLPLLAQRHFGLRLADVFTTHRDGLEPEELFQLCGPLRRWRPPFLTLVSLPVWLNRKKGRGGGDIYQAVKLANAEKARFILQSMFRRLRRMLGRVQPAPRTDSAWSGYMETHSYDQGAFAAKEEFVRDVLRECAPARVLDVGANTGHFSRLSARAGAAVVAIDYDAACVGEIWRSARAEKLSILPLVVDLSRPSSALGWRNRECPSFLERATGQFDAVLMLAVLHHLLVSERIPLAEVLDLAAELTRDALIIEFVAPQDEMFRRLARGRDALFTGLDAAVFEAACSRRFEIVRQAPLPNTARRLYHLRRRAG